MNMKLSNYYHPTPTHLKKLGDCFLLVSTTLSTAVMGAPFTEHNKLWIVFCLNLLGMLGKLLTNLFKEDPKELKPGQEN